MIITLISPIKFKKEAEKIYNQLSSDGHVVLHPVYDACNTGDDITLETLVSLHKEKIDMADRIIVINAGGYMGRGTYEEIGYATIKQRPIEYLDTCGYLPPIDWARYCSKPKPKT